MHKNQKNTYNNKMNTHFIKKSIIGFFAGIVSGLFASGGGLIVVPALVHILKMDEKLARGTTLFSILPMVLTSSFLYAKHVEMDIKMISLCTIGGIAGGAIGAKFLKKVPDKILKISFTAFLYFASIKMLVSM